MSSALRAVYDVAHAPITFDFGVFLALTECARQLSGRDAIDLTVMAREYRDITPRDKLLTPAEKAWRLKNIVMDCCELLPTITNYGLVRTPRDGQEFEFPPIGSTFPYLAKDVLRLFKAGANPRCLKAPEHAKALAKIDRPYVTLTLRTSTHFPERNVKPMEWRKFANTLKDKYAVVVVPDQDDLLGSNTSHEYFNEPWIGWARPAAMDIRMRLALYEGAVMNFCSANGPTALMFYTDAPVLQFDQMRGGTFDEKAWEKLNGFPVGEQFPWSLPTQRMTWTDSNFETLVSEWRAIESRL